MSEATMCFDKNKFSRVPNLKENDGLTVYNGFGSQQNPKAYELFYDLLKLAKPNQILEIGTGLGGLTVYLRMCCDELHLQTFIRSYDIYDRPEYSTLSGRGIEVIIGNVFHDDYSRVDESVIEFIQREGISLILCDGGYKIGEFNLLSNYLKSGDIIMAHDYAPDQEYFEKYMRGRIWNWMEIEDNRVEETIAKNKLVPYEDVDFLKGAWLCKRKS